MKIVAPITPWVYKLWIVTRLIGTIVFILLRNGLNQRNCFISFTNPYMLENDKQPQRKHPKGISQVLRLPRLILDIFLMRKKSRANRLSISTSI